MKIALTLEGKLAYIADVANGAKCQCVCLECREPVIARQGTQREWHFAHQSTREPCTINPETFLHRFVKQTIDENRGLVIPEAPIGLKIPDAFNATLVNNWVAFDRVEEEVWLGDRRPDIIGYVGTERMLIEVAYSSFCDHEKIEALNSRGLATLEIDVSHFDCVDFDPSSVRHAVLMQASIKKWLVLPEAQSATDGPTIRTTSTPAASARPTITEHSSRLINGRRVWLKQLQYGEIALGYDYGEEVSATIRDVAHRFHGYWDKRYKNWRIKGCWLPDVVLMLDKLHDPTSFR